MHKQYANDNIECFETDSGGDWLLTSNVQGLVQDHMTFVVQFDLELHQIAVKTFFEW